MKTLTTLTAVAALIVGMSIAGAQGQQTQSPNATSMKAAPATAKKALVKGTGQFCATTKTDSNVTGKVNCKYASLEACQKDPNLKGRQCGPRPPSTTSGAN